MITSPELEQVFNDSVPLLFQRDALRCIVKCYPEAETMRNTYGIHKPVADWHLPFGRRALIESQLLELAERYQPLQAEIRYTKNHSAPYLAVTAGQFVITVSKIDEPTRLPRDADFRTENSLVNYSLFAELEESPPDSPIYVILAHVPHFDEARPASVEWLFPDGAYTCVKHRIDLLKKFADTRGQAPAAATPAVDPKPKLRKRADDKGEAQA